MIRRRLATISAVALAAGLLGGGATTAVAGTFSVTNGADAGAGSYREAIADASGAIDGPDVINFAPGLTVTLTSGDVAYTGTEDLTLNGNGSIIDGSDAHQILEADTATSVSVNDLTMTRGRTDGDGAAIDAVDAEIVVTNSTLSDNTTIDGAGAEEGGAIETQNGNVTVTNSTLSGNTALFDGGAIRTSGNATVTVSNSMLSGNTGGDEGGAIQTGSVMVTNSTLSGNMSADEGGAIAFVTEAIVTGSTLSRNTADGEGGAIQSFGGTATVTNSTLSGNTGNGEGGAIQTGTNGATVLTYVTVASNSAPDGQVDANDLTAFGTVFSDPQGGGANCDVVGGTTTSNGFNYSTDASCGLTGTGDTEGGADPDLEPLGDFGGPAETRPPSVTSPLVDAIPVADCVAGIAVDQRGLPRPAGGNDDGTDGCDIGAVELQPSQPPPPVGPIAGPIAGRPSFTG